ncbi:hypothetical protein ABZ342_29615 [Amycolatopsis sp. NPDC005961]|uniref:hypothetical protein n=1 Tax=Amycolatopsis sp. NPDC005961 TaxID=3156720 RepID=UPI0033EA7C3B
MPEAPKLNLGALTLAAPAFGHGERIPDEYADTALCADLFAKSRSAGSPLWGDRSGSRCE